MAPPIVHDVLASVGQPLEPAVRESFESRFGRDFSGVRVHADEVAGDSAAAVNALAYTVGSHVVFAAGQYRPGTYDGEALLAHELAHVTQQAETLLPIAPLAIEPPHSRAEREAENAADAVMEDREPTLGSFGLSLAAKRPEGAPDKIPPPGAFFVARLGRTYIYTFNSEDLRSWTDPEFRIFSYYAKDAFDADETTARKFVADLKTRSGKQPPLAFQGINPVRLASQRGAVSVPILLELHETFTVWLKEHKLGEPQKVQSGYRELDEGDRGAGGQKGEGGRKSDSGKTPGGGIKPGDIVIQVQRQYSYLLRQFPKHEVFSRFGATPDDLARFAGNRPEPYAALPAVPADLAQAPADPGPWQSFLDQWRAFIFALMQAKERSQEGEKKPGEKKGAPDGIRRFKASAKLQIVGELPKYVKGSRIQFLVVFDRSNDDNFFMNFPPFERRALFDWNVFLSVKDLAPVQFDSGPIIEQGTREYDLTLDKVGTYSATVTISSPYFSNELIVVRRDNIRVVTEQERTREVFDTLLVDKANPATPFERDADGHLQLKPGQEPFSIKFELDLLESEKKRIPDLVKQGALTQAQADEYLKYLDAQRTGLNEIKGEEDKAGDFKRYFAEGVYLSRETSQSVRLRSTMFRRKRWKSPRHLIYGLDLVDATTEPENPTHHPGEADITGYSRVHEAQGWVKAEKLAIAGMADHFHSHNNYPDGTVSLAVKRIEDGQLMQVPPIDTANPGKTFRAVFGYIGLAAGIVALAATPFTGGGSAPLGLIILQASAIAIGITTVLAGMWERYQQEQRIKADKRLALDVVTLVASVMGAGGFSNAVRGASIGGRLMYVGTMAGLDVGTGVIMTLSTRDEILRIEAIYAVRIADEKDPAKRRQMEAERDAAIARIIGSAALNGAFVLASTASGAHQIVSAVGRKSGAPYSVRQEVLDLAASAKTVPDAIRARLGEDPALTPAERAFLQEALLVPREQAPTSAGEITEQKIAKLGAMTDDTRDWLRDPANKKLLDALAEDPRASAILKHCSEICFPRNMTAEQYHELRGILARAERYGGYNAQMLNEFLYRNRAELDEAIRYLNGLVENYETQLGAQGRLQKSNALRPDDPIWSEKAEHVAEIASKGRETEVHLQGDLAKRFARIARQVRIRPNRSDGKPADFYFIADYVVTDETGFAAIDAKLTKYSPLTHLQEIGYPMLRDNGGTVESRIAEGLPYGTPLPKGTRAQIAVPNLVIGKERAPAEGVTFTYTDIR
jgi:hypothetical protein